MYKINHANIKEWAANYEGELFDGILCDPPYHLVSMTKRWGSENAHNTPIMDTKEGGVFARSAKGFMGKEWDGVDENGIGIAQDPEMWRLLYNLLKPGAHLLAFSGSRTYHRMAVAIEDAGFEIRDMIEWVYGSGFPKSLNISDAIAKREGAKREGAGSTGNTFPLGQEYREYTQTENSQIYKGYGTALKPAHEPCVLARKPLEGTVANNVLKHGTGGLNIDGTRVGTSGARFNGRSVDSDIYGKYGVEKPKEIYNYGRFPANLIHDGSDEVEAVFPNESSRFFYSAKASKSERNAGLEGFELKQASKMSGGEETRADRPTNHPHMQNFHPTVKPLSLTKYLATLIKPPTGGRLLVPFSGSGSEMIGALQAGWEYVEGVELTEEYIPIAEARIKYWQNIPQTSLNKKSGVKKDGDIQNELINLTLI